MLHDSYDIILDFTAATALKMPTNAFKQIFLVQSSNLLIAIILKKWNWTLTVQSLSLKCLSLANFHNAPWKCGSFPFAHCWIIVETWNNKQHFPMNFPPVVDVFEWTGPVASVGVPKFVKWNAIKDWSSVSDHFLLHEFHPTYIELFFVNQIQSTHIGTVLFLQ